MVVGEGVDDNGVVVAIGVEGHVVVVGEGVEGHVVVVGDGVVLGVGVEVVGVFEEELGTVVVIVEVRGAVVWRVVLICELELGSVLNIIRR